MTFSAANSCENKNFLQEWSPTNLEKSWEWLIAKTKHYYTKSGGGRRCSWRDSALLAIIVFFYYKSTTRSIYMFCVYIYYTKPTIYKCSIGAWDWCSPPSRSLILFPYIQIWVIECRLTWYCNIARLDTN